MYSGSEKEISKNEIEVLPPPIPPKTEIKEIPNVTKKSENFDNTPALPPRPKFNN